VIRWRYWAPGPGGRVVAMTQTTASTVAPRPGPATGAAIQVRGLRVRYGDFEAVRGIELDVRRGEVFASLVAAQLAVVVGMTIYVTATQTVVARRHSLVLKRMRTSGVPDGGLLAATLTPCVVIALVQLLLFVPFDIYLGVSAPVDPVALVLAALGGLALAVTAALATTVVTASPERAQITTLPMVFVLLGAAVATAVLPVVGWWQALAVVPGAAIGLLVRFAFLGGGWDVTGGLPAMLPALVALVVWPVVFALLARRSFRWEPRR
jgi:ABC-2 type transport system permease protein